MQVILASDYIAPSYQLSLKTTSWAQDSVPSLKSAASSSVQSGLINRALVQTAAISELLVGDYATIRE